MQTPPPDAGLRLLVADDDPTVAEAVAGRRGPVAYEVTRADDGPAVPATRADDRPAAPACAARRRPGRPGHSTTTEG